MDDDTYDAFVYMTSTPQGKNEWYRRFVDSIKTAEPRYIGVDWASGHGMIRGEVISRDANVIHVRFKDVGI